MSGSVRADLLPLQGQDRQVAAKDHELTKETRYLANSWKRIHTAEELDALMQVVEKAGDLFLPTFKYQVKDGVFLSCQMKRGEDSKLRYIVRDYATACDEVVTEEQVDGFMRLAILVAEIAVRRFGQEIQKWPDHNHADSNAISMANEILSNCGAHYTRATDPSEHSFDDKPIDPESVRLWEEIKKGEALFPKVPNHLQAEDIYDHVDFIASKYIAEWWYCKWRQSS